MTAASDRLSAWNDLYRTLGADLTEIPGVNSLIAQMLLTEIGPNLDRFLTAGAFCSWLRLCPDPKIRGGQRISSRTRPTENRTLGNHVIGELHELRLVPEYFVSPVRTTNPTFAIGHMARRPDFDRQSPNLGRRQRQGWRSIEQDSET
jgi:hypothetical protein